MRKVIILLLAVFSVVGIFSKTQAGISRSGVLFLRIAAGARAAGMGETFVAVANDATATHWNPAGLGFYPLNSDWLEFKLDKANQKLERIALAKNDQPDNNYKKYDLWGLTGKTLWRWDGQKWVDYFVYKTSPQESFESIIRKYTQVNDEEKIKGIIQEAAARNNSIRKDSLISLQEKILKALPSDFPKRPGLENILSDFLEKWDSGLIDEEKIKELTQTVTSALVDGQILPQEVDKITTAISSASRKELKKEIYLPFSLVFEDSLTAICSGDEGVWVGTAKGLYHNEKMNWNRFDTSSGLPSNHITFLTQTKTGSIWAGTPSGIAQFVGKKWNPFPFEPNVKDKEVIKIAAKTDNKVWVATKNDLFKLNGQNWENFTIHRMILGETPWEVVKKFLGTEDSSIIQTSLADLEKFNNLPKDSMTAGKEIKFPYALALNGVPTALEIDDLGKLWLGTNEGIKSFDGERWTTFGYKVYQTQENDTPESIAAKFLNTKDTTRINILAEKIKSYNKLEAHPLFGGRKIYVYFNPVGSKILSIASAGGDKVYVGTELGTLKYDGSNWNRYYHADLENAQIQNIESRFGETWFATKDKVVIYAHAKREINFMHANLLPELTSDIFYEYFSYVQNLEGWGTLGGNITYINYGDIARTGESPTIINTFSAYEGALTASYGIKLTHHLSTGISAKFIYSHLSDVGAGREKGKGVGTSFAVDGGILYQTPVKRLTLGAAVTNLGPNISYIDADQSDPLPRNLAVGFAYKVFDTPFNRLTVTGDLNKELIDLNQPRSVEIRETVRNFGLEYWYGTYVALRAGYIYDYYGGINTPTFGAGLQYNVFQIDFAYIPSTKDQILSNTMRISLTGRF